MAMTPFVKMISKLCPNLWKTDSYLDILVMYEKGQFRDAYAALCDGLETQAQWCEDADLYLLCADLELRLNNDVSKARQLLDKALKVGSFDESYYYRTRGYIMWKSGERGKAIQDLERSVEAERNVFNLITLAGILFEAGDQRAMSLCQQVLEEDPHNCLAHIYIAWDAAKSGDRDKALAIAKEAEELAASANDVFDVGRLYHQLDKFQCAVNKYLEADRLGCGEQGLLYAAIADCYLSLGKARLYRTYLKRAIKRDPENEYVKEMRQEYEEKFRGKTQK